MHEMDVRSRGLGTPPQSPKTDELLRNTENMQSCERRPFAWLPLIAISFCLVAHTVAVSSLFTYVGVCVQYLLDLPSLNASGEHVARSVFFASVVIVVHHVVSTNKHARPASCLHLAPTPAHLLWIYFRLLRGQHGRMVRMI